MEARGYGRGAAEVPVVDGVLPDQHIRRCWHKGVEKKSRPVGAGFAVAGVEPAHLVIARVLYHPEKEISK